MANITVNETIVMNKFKLSLAHLPLFARFSKIRIILIKIVCPIQFVVVAQLSES